METGMLLIEDGEEELKIEYEDRQVELLEGSDYRLFTWVG